MPTPENVEINEQRIDLRCLMRGVSRIDAQMLEIGHEWGEEEGSDLWSATAQTGGPNDREWKEVARAPTFVGLLRNLGRHGDT